MELKGNTDGFGVNAGVFVQVNEKWKVGASYRSGINYILNDGSVNITVPPSAQNQFPANPTFSSELPSPDVYSIGVSSQLTKRLLVAADINYNTWSVFKNLDIEFNRNTDGLQDISLPHQWKNTTSIRLGAQYVRSCCLSFRAGVAFEQSPVNRTFYFPDAPDANRFTFHTGFSYDFDDHWSLDLAAILIETKQIEGNYSPIDFRGVYKSRTIIGSAGISYVF